MSLSHKDLDGLRNVINKMSVYVQTANVDIARLKLEILSLKNHVQNLEKVVLDLQTGADAGVDADADADAGGPKSASNVKIVGNGNRNGELDTNSALQQLSQLTAGMGNRSSNSTRVPM